MKRIIFPTVALLILALCLCLSACNEPEAQQHEITLYDNDTVIGTRTVTVGEEYELGLPMRQGYSFLGWYSAPSGGLALTDSSGGSAGMSWTSDSISSAYAQWSANDYKITFDYRTDEEPTVKDISVAYDEKITAGIPVPRRSGYSFLGWYTATVGGDMVVDRRGKLLADYEVYNAAAFSISGEGTVLYARWGDKKVTFSFVAGDGTPVEDITFGVGDVINEFPSSALNNHSFVSWCYEPTMSSEVTFPLVITDDIDDYVTLYANFLSGSLDILTFKTISSTADKEYEVSYSGDAEEIIIPDLYYGKPITRVVRIDAPNAKKNSYPSYRNGYRRRSV